MNIDPTTRQHIRKHFTERHDFAFDPFQIEAMDALDSGDSVLVAAPTGSGKTLVAEYAVEVAIHEGYKVFYTTPLKALSNQKYHDLVHSHGPTNVGLLTGDNSINPEAPAVVMTTEVLRNMIYASSSSLERLRYVVLDEVHYLQNAYRGPVWEEVIIHAPPGVTLVCLSATVSNTEELSDWIKTVRGAMVPVVEERRPIQLEQHYLVGKRNDTHLTMVPSFGPNGRPNSRAAAFDTPRARRGWRQPKLRSPYATPHRADVVGHLSDHDMLPAIYFIFSRNACDDAVRQCINSAVRLTSSSERQVIRGIAEDAVTHLSDEDLGILDYERWLDALEAGIAAHHAGLVPPFKEAVETCFAQALVKVVFATETLALGINMPARTVVIEKLSKFTGERHEILTPGEYTQLTGRAGRRGIDDVGHAVVLWSPFIPFEQVASLASTRSYALTSSFRPTYNMAANLVRRYSPDVAHHLLNLSFAQYRTDADIVRLETQLEQLSERIATLEHRVVCDRGDVRNAVAELQAESHVTPDNPESVSRGVNMLKVGDIIGDPDSRRDAHLVIISTAQRRGHETRLGVITHDGRRFTLVPHDFVNIPHKMGRVELPKPYNPANKEFIKRAVSSLAGVVDESTKSRHRPITGAANCPDFADHRDALSDIERLNRERDNIEKRVKSRSESLARQFDRVIGLLRSLGYVDNWELTQTGMRLARVYHESDLLIVECLHRGHFDDLTAPEVAALASTFTYESRGPGGTGPEPYFHTDALKTAVDGVTATWREISDLERSSTLPQTRGTDAGFCAFAYAWVAGEDLADVLGDDELSGGDFVRNVKQLVDLLRQLGDVAAADRPRTAKAARQGATGLFRDIVAASSVESEPADEVL